MKTTSFIKKAMLMVTFVTPVLFLASCGTSQQRDNTRVVAEERNDAIFVDNKQVNDAQFLVSATENNLKQIQLGQLAQQKGSTTQVKEWGKMMVDTHTKAQRDLAALASRKSITIPTTLTGNARDTYKDLNDKSGYDFDKEYAEMMVSRHKDAIKDFEKASTDSYDNDIKSWATASLVDMRKNLDSSIESQKRSDEMNKTRQ